MTGLGHWLDDVFNVLNRVGNAGVFSLAGVIKINAAIGQHLHVFQQCVATDSLIDLRFGLRRQFDGLGVAAAFEVEHAVMIPAVFVIADQLTFGIGGEGGFTGTGQAKEHRHVTLFADVGRTVH
ncbi:hypothetical protein D3C75_847890 [compost metagenome]